MAEIRLKQLNKPELSGFIFDAIYGSGLSVGGSIIPSTGGSYDLGSPSQRWSEIYSSGNIGLLEGGGIYFGDSFLTVSGSSLLLDGSPISGGGGEGFGIVGDAGPSGATGASGLMGPTGISITGVSGVGSGLYGGFTQAVFLLSDGSFSDALDLPSGRIGPSGATGVIGPTGAVGAQGLMGGFLFEFQAASGLYSGEGNPIAPVDGFAGYNPSLTLLRGFTYNFGYGGLAVTSVDLDGILIPTNYFSNGDYLRFSLFSSATSGGRYTSGEGFPAGLPGLSGTQLSLDQLFISSEYSLYKDSLSASIKYSSDSGFKYGFERMDYTTDASSTPKEIFVLGVLNIIDHAPTGPAGPSGSVGLQGEQGNVGPSGSGATGPSGVAGPAGAEGVQGVDGPTGPSGAQGIQGIPGPSGAIGPTGTQGPIGTGMQGAAGPAGDRYKTTFQVNTTAIDKNGTDCTACLFTLEDEIELVSNDLKNFSYTSSQRLLFAVTQQTGKYFAGRVKTYNEQNGQLIIKVVEPYSLPSGYIFGQPYFDAFAFAYAIDVNVDAIQGPIGLSGVAGPSGATGPTGPSGATGLPGTITNNFFGEWSAASGYSSSDIVSNSGSSYISLTSNINSNPYTGANDWRVLALRGEVGPSGATGATGSTGQTGSIGPIGTGVNVTGFHYSGENSGYVVFDLSNGSGIGPVLLPSGATGVTGATGATGPAGPSGAAGPSGHAGSITNNFSGEWSGIYSYLDSDVVSLSGSSYVSIANSLNINPSTGTAHWRTLALKGGVGATGPTGEVAFNLGTGIRLLNSYVNNYFDFNEKTAQECVITGNNVYVNFSGHCATGETVLLKIKHSGIDDILDENRITDNPFFWDNMIYWPYNTPPMFTTTSGNSNMFTFVRFRDKGTGAGDKVYLGTYAPEYYI